MNLVIRFSNPGLPARRKMVERIAKRVAFPLDRQATDKLALMSAAPAFSLLALGGRATVAVPAPIGFDPTLSSADVDLVGLADRVVGSPSRALSFCLSARHLGERLDMEVLEKRYSDLSSMYLGESEKAIAAAFEESADLRAFLIVDEADSLLRDRSAARNSWKITQVNEMLTWMEHHPYPFACTTNALDALDPATARRFLFKVRFLAMDSGQIAAAFLRAFDTDAPKSILKLEGLTPSDFAVVVRKAEVLRERGQIPHIERSGRAKNASAVAQ